MWDSIFGKQITNNYIFLLNLVTKDREPYPKNLDLLRGMFWGINYLFGVNKRHHYSAIKRNKIELFVVRWMNLESVIQSEVSQKEKNKYCMLTHIYGI